jgi:hypothetical protein
MRNRPVGRAEPDDQMGQFGIGSEFGFEIPLRFFSLLNRARKPIPGRFGMRSVSVDTALPAQKTRYKSSTYCPSSVLSELLIIGRSKAWAAPLSPFGPTILLFFIGFL